MFEKELSAVFVRWWEESDLEDHEMAEIAVTVIERFCDTDIEFEPDQSSWTKQATSNVQPRTD